MRPKSIVRIYTISKIQFTPIVDMYSLTGKRIPGIYNLSNRCYSIVGIETTCTNNSVLNNTETQLKQCGVWLIIIKKIQVFLR